MFTIQKYKRPDSFFVAIEMTKENILEVLAYTSLGAHIDPAEGNISVHGRNYEFGDFVMRRNDTAPWEFAHAEFINNQGFPLEGESKEATSWKWPK